MKSINKISIALISLLLILSSCTQYDLKEPGENIFPGEKKDPTYTIAQLLAQYGNPSIPFGVTEIKNDNPVIINGIITSSDIGGNVYKYIVLQEENENGRALRVSVDAAGISSLYPLGMRVSVYLNGLYLGNYGQSPQIGTYDLRGTDQRIQPGSIPYILRDKYVFPYGTPDKAAVVADTMTIAEVLAADRVALNYRLICIKNAWFTGKGADRNRPVAIGEADKIFAPKTGGIGYPQSREIQDGTGSLFVSTSEYSKFATQPLPADTIVGNITALVSWYKTTEDSPGAGEIYHQLTLRSLADLEEGYEPYLTYLSERSNATGKGTEAEPYNIGGAFVNQGATAEQWVKGYIVGTFESYGTNFEAPFNTKLNILLATFENETNGVKTLCIELPNGKIQEGLNLVNNASLYKQQIRLNGKLENYNNMPGMKNIQSVVLENGTVLKNEPVTE